VYIVLVFIILLNIILEINAVAHIIDSISWFTFLNKPLLYITIGRLIDTYSATYGNKYGSNKYRWVSRL